MPRDKIPDPGTLTALAVSGMAMSAATGGVGIFQSVQGASQATQEGQRAADITNRLAGIRAQEGQMARRRVAARAQLMGATGGSPTSEASVGQIATDIDRQTALDVWSIRERGYAAQSAAANQSAALQNQAIAEGAGVGSRLIQSGIGYHELGVF